MLLDALSIHSQHLGWVVGDEANMTVGKNPGNGNFHNRLMEGNWNAMPSNFKVSEVKGKDGEWDFS